MLEKLENKDMRKIVQVSLLCFILVSLVVPVYASVNTDAFVGDNFHISFDFRNLDSATYSAIMAAYPDVFNSTSIPRAIVKSLGKQGFNKVSYPSPPSIVFSDAEKSIHVEFFLEGADVISYTVNKTSLARLYTARTTWIKFEVKLTITLTLNFTSYFTTQVSNWQKINRAIGGITYTAFYFSSAVSQVPLDSSCYIILPATALNIEAVGTTVIFEMPSLPEDRLINSPILILGAIVLIDVVFIVYRKIRK